MRGLNTFFISSLKKKKFNFELIYAVSGCLISRFIIQPLGEIVSFIGRVLNVSAAF